MSFFRYAHKREQDTARESVPRGGGGCLRERHLRGIPLASPELIRAHGQTNASEAETSQLSARVEVLMLSEERAKEYSAELVALKEQLVDTVAMLEALRKEKTTLQAQGQQVCERLCLCLHLFLYLYLSIYLSIYKTMLYMHRCCATPSE